MDSFLNQGFLGSAAALLRQQWGVQLNATDVVISAEPLSTSPEETGVGLRAVGVPPTWVGEFHQAVGRLDLQALLPAQLTYYGPYPCTFAELAQYLLDAYGLRVEPNDFRQATRPDAALLPTSVVDVPLNAFGELELVTSVDSHRWRAGTPLLLLIQTP